MKRWKFFLILVLIFGIFFGVFYSLNNDKNTYSSEGLNIKNSKSNMDSEINKIFKELQVQEDKANIISGHSTKEKTVALTFDGLADSENTEKLLKLLDEYDEKATFFITGMEVAEEASIVKKIISSNHEIGNYTLSAQRNMEDLPDDEIIRDFYLASNSFKKSIRKNPKILKCNETEYTDRLLEIIKACGMDNVVESTHIFNHKSFSSYEEVLNYTKKIKKGDIISIKIGDYIGEKEYNSSIREEKPAIDKKHTIDKYKKVEILDENEEIIKLTKWLLMALRENGYNTVYVENLPNLYYADTYRERPVATSVSNTKKIKATSPKGCKKPRKVEKNINPVLKNYYVKLRKENKGETSNVIKHMYTTDTHIAYVIRGVKNQGEVLKLLDALDKIDGKGSFFVTAEEISNYPDILNEIVSRGHLLCNGGYGKNRRNPSLLGFSEIVYEIDMGEKALKEFLGKDFNSSNKYYMPLYGDTGGYVLEAASCLGYKNTIIYNRNPVRESYKNLDADAIIGEYFKNTVALHRGDIVYFNLDFFEKKGISGDLAFKIFENYIKEANYEIASIDNLINSPLVYTPNLDENKRVANLIKESYDYESTKLQYLIENNYIGNPGINTIESLIGFTEEEIEHIDSIGRIDTKGEKIIFLTFDDWGSDIAISKILNVLDKYNVKANFFIRVGYGGLDYHKGVLNPNLLRAIAVKDHDIGNHTYRHEKVNISREDEVAILQKDIVIAHRAMAEYIGDLNSFKPFFRPPTLAVSKLGLETVFNTGFNYIINGDFSTQDYEAPSVEFLVSTFIDGINLTDRKSNVNENTDEKHIRKIQPGSIIVMHMSDEAKYTAEALDIVIPYYLNKGYRFEKLSNYLDDEFMGDRHGIN
ncbi:MAG: polysaccharide deacetylase family protein [Tissierellia bacterium]|nr:polysaccharide deacetylase family protein [Tissierellia bacterium]